MTAFKKPKDIYQGPYYLPEVDFEPTFKAWRFLGGEGQDAFLRGLGNSVLFASVSAFLAVVIGAFAAYGLARYEYKYAWMKNNDLSFLIVSQRMMPPIVARDRALHDVPLGRPARQPPRHDHRLTPGTTCRSRSIC